MQNIRELSNCAAQGHLLSSLVLCGGALEAILLAALEARRADAMQAKRAPRKDGATHHLDRWELSDLLKVAEELKLLPPGIIHLSNGLREFRNYIHPGKRTRESYGLIGAEVTAGVAVLKMVISHLTSS